MNLTDHFSIDELTHSQTAARCGISNLPGAAEIENLRRVCAGILEPVRDHFAVPFAPLSGYRCAALNRAIGGAASSQHMTGQAVDFRVPGVANLDVAGWIRDTLAFDQLILEFPEPGDPHAGWVHCSLTATDNRGDVLTLTRAGYTAGLCVN